MKFLKSAFSLDRLLGLGLLVLLLFLKWTEPYPVEFLRLKTFDYYQQLKPREIPPPEKKPVTIIDIDETSLAKIGQWPWSRSTIAKLINNTKMLGASLIAFDIVFAEPDRLNPSNVANSLVGLDEQTKEKILSIKSNDKILSEAMSNFRVVLGQAGRNDRVEGQESRRPKKKRVAERKSKGALNPRVFLPSFPYLTKNLDILEKGNSKKFGGAGMFNVIPDRDGMIRNVPAFFVHDFCKEKGIVRENKEKWLKENPKKKPKHWARLKKKCQIIYPGLGPEMMRVNTWTTSKKIDKKTKLPRPKSNIVVSVDQAGIQKVQVDKNLQIVTTAYGRIWPYFSLKDSAKYVPAHEILDGTADPKMLEGKMTIVGTSAVGLQDIKAVPTEGLMPGVELHAQVVEAAILNQYLERPGYFAAAELAFIMLAGLIIVILVPWIGAKWTAVVFVLSATGAAGTSWYMFAEERLLLDASYAVLSIMIIYMVLTYTGYAREEAQRRQTRAAFSKYLSPDMVSRVAENPEELKLGGEERDLTLLFCDVRGFTPISELFTPQGLTALINKLLTPLTNQIMARQGTVDKYMGDCIMAFWNAPLDDENHERNGCLSALAMLAEMDPLNERLEQEAKEEGRKHLDLKVGLGLNSGPCVVGNMGSDQRFDYSVLGDTVNLAARLEGQSKGYGVRIVLGPSTAEKVTDLAILELDNIQVKGKTEAVQIFGLVGDDEMASTDFFQGLKPQHDRMLELYKAQKWDEGLAAAKECREYAKDAPFEIDGFYELYETRCIDYKAEPPVPPGEDWDGVFVATTK